MSDSKVEELERENRRLTEELRRCKLREVKLNYPAPPQQKQSSVAPALIAAGAQVVSAAVAKPTVPVEAAKVEEPKNVETGKPTN